MQDFIALGTAIRIILHTDSEFVYHPEESLLLRSIAGIFNPRPLGLSIHGSMAFIGSMENMKHFMMNQTNQQNRIGIIKRFGMNRDGWRFAKGDGGHR
tara:strand:- start:801 stop:1094 length:294 start_codon:yes stop_codon:yes gene_type:complete